MTAEEASQNSEQRATAEQLASSPSFSGDNMRPPEPPAAAAEAVVAARKRPVVAVDVDEVLGQFVTQLCAFHNGTYGTAVTPDFFNCYNFNEVWGGSREQADTKMRRFFQSPYFLEGVTGHGLPVVEGAAEVLRRHSRSFELHIVTSRQHILEEHTRAWVQKHYPDIFAESNFHFGNHFSSQGTVRSKPDLCRAIDAVLIIDDNMRYATECAAAGIRTCLFGDYAWNRTSEPLPANVTRTVSWKEVDATLCSIANEYYGHHDGVGDAGTVSTAGGLAEEPEQQQQQQRGGGSEAGGEVEARGLQGKESLASRRNSCVEIDTNVNGFPPGEQDGGKVLLEGKARTSSSSSAAAAARDRKDSQSNVVVEDMMVDARA